MHGCEKRHAQSTQQREMQPVNVRMYDVEFLRLLRNRFKQKSSGGHRVSTLPSEAQRVGPYWVKPAACPRIAARKKSDCVTALDQFIDQPGDHPLRASVELGRHTLG